MQQRWIFTFLFLVFASGMAYADTTVSITNNPFVLNPAITTNLSVDFTLTNATFLAGTDAYDIQFYVSDNATFDQGVDTEISGSNTTFAALTCGGDILTSGATCTHSFPIGAQSDGSKYIVLVVTLNAITPSQTSQSILFDSVSPSGTIANTTSPLVGTFVGTLFPTFTITGDAGGGANLTIGALNINGHDRVLTFTSNVATYTAVAEDGLAAGSTYTVTANSLMDAAGNQSSNPITISFTIDQTAPTDPTLSASTNYSNDKTPNISVTSTDAGAGQLTAMLKCNDGASYTSVTMTGSPFSVDTFDVTTGPGCPSTSGERTVKVKVKDGLGNESAEASVTIKYDGTKPAKPSGLDDTDVTDDLIAFDWDGSSDEGGSGIDEYVVFRHTSDDFDDADEIDTTDDSEYSDDGLSACTDYYYWVQAKDNAGNVSEESETLDIKTEGCPTNTNNDDDDSSSNNNTGFGGGGGGGGSGAGTCDVTIEVPTKIYAGETIVVKASGSNYANGLLYAFETGKPNVEIKKTVPSANSWTGNYTVPSKIGNNITFRLKTDGCISKSSVRPVLDPKNKTVTPPAAAKTDPVDNEDADETELVAETTAVTPASATIALSIETLPQLLSLAGFNADNVEQRVAIEKLINGMGLIETIRVVPSNVAGKYQIQIALEFTNTGNHGSLKIVQSIPKEFAEMASQIESNYPMTILQDDPLIQVVANDLKEGQQFTVQFTTKETYTAEEANAQLDVIKGKMGTVPLLFASGSARPGDNGGGLASLSGLVGAAGATAPIVLGFVLVLGLIFVSVRVVRGSVQGSDNPILRSASRAGDSNIRPLNASVRGNKKWGNRNEDA